MTVTLLEVVAAANQHAAALPGELAGYLLLATAEQVAAAPRCPAIHDVALDDDGGVRVIGGAAVAESLGERRLRELFAFTLGKSAPVTPALVRVAQRAPSGSLRGLIQELEAALIPLNRGASRRALARLCRETTRAADRGELVDLAPLAAAADARAEPTAIVSAAPAEPVASEPFDVPVSVEETTLPPPAASAAHEPSVPLAAPPHVAQCVESPEAYEPPEGAALEALLTAASPAPPDSSAAPTPVLRTEAAVPTPAPDSVREESTRPEPVIARASQRPEAPNAAPDPTLTPVLGSLADPECIPVEAARDLPDVVVAAGDATERMPDVVEPLPSPPPPVVAETAEPEPEPAAEPESVSAELWPCEGFIAWESCAPPPVAHTASVAVVDEEALAVDAAWDDVAREVERAFETIQATAQSVADHAPVLAPCAVLPLESLTLTAPGGIVAERPLEPTPAKTPSAAPKPAWAPARFLPRKSDVDALLRGFCVADSRDERELCRKLCEIAGVEASSSAR